MCVSNSNSVVFALFSKIVCRCVLFCVKESHLSFQKKSTHLKKCTNKENQSYNSCVTETCDLRWRMLRMLRKTRHRHTLTHMHTHAYTRIHMHIPFVFNTHICKKKGTNTNIKKMEVFVNFTECVMGTATKVKRYRYMWLKICLKN